LCADFDWLKYTYIKYPLLIKNYFKDTGMIKLKYILIVAALLSAYLPAQKKSGWVSLFDGKTLSGWHSYGKSTAGSAWKAENGILHLDAANKEDGHIVNGGDLVTDAEYDNFHLKLDWKAAPGSNSGIIFYVKEDTSLYHSPWQTGPEMQVLDDERHPDCKLIKHKAGDLYDLISISKNVIKPAGEWNHVEIIANKGNLQFVINGEKVLSAKMWDSNWNNLISLSKFKDMPGFGKFKKGKICLQDHGDEVWFRNIEIIKLK
jgi:hypothetical protein